MKNGGGPACLRLPIVMTKTQIEQANSHVFYTERLHERLTEWIKKHYRDELNPSDLADPQLLKESREALDQLTRILELGSVYEFQNK